MLSLDTHIVVAAFEGNLRRDEEQVLSADAWGIASIVLWEIQVLARNGRIRLTLQDRDFARFLQSLTIWPLDFDVCRTIAQLDFRSDPADEIIAATSLVHDVPLVTRDQRLLASRVVPLALA